MLIPGALIHGQKFRTREMIYWIWGICLVGGGILLGQTIEAHLTSTRIVGIAGLIATVLIGFRGVTVGIITYDDCIKIRNVFTTRQVQWSDIESFSMGAWTWMPYVCRVNLVDGRSRPAMGIQERSFFPNGSGEKLVDELNAKLARVSC
jgi:hypothetical protein